MNSPEDKVTKEPRLYVAADLCESASLALEEAHSHYLRNVLRRSDGDRVRLFNGRHGEWLAALRMEGKKGVAAAVQRCLRPQPNEEPQQTHLLFAPIKKARQEIMLEKAVELGVTHLQPVLTRNTEVRELRHDRNFQNLIEAAEQCERLTVPALLPLKPLAEILGTWPEAVPLLACVERRAVPRLTAALCAARGPLAFLIGPEGGFTAEEHAALQAQGSVRPVSLGESILRAETAALVCLALRQANF